jgi:hypothetical protein
MKSIVNWLFFLVLTGSSFAQKVNETSLVAPMKKATVFFTGAQLQHELKTEVKSGKSVLVFQKLTNFLDPNTIQVKAAAEVTILSVRMRKNYEDQSLSRAEMDKLNERKSELTKRDKLLRDEYAVLEMDKTLLQKNRDLKSSTDGLKVSELKEAYAFMHQKMDEILKREAQIRLELEDIQKKSHQIEQEIISQRSKPVINYSEVVVEIEAVKTTSAAFILQYITPNATWYPFYDLRSEGIGKPIRLEAKGNVSQTTGIEWNDIEMVLSTNDPYQNTQEPNLQPWYIYYYNQPQSYEPQQRSIPNFDFAGQTIRGEVMDAVTGEPLPFAQVAFYNNPAVNVVTDFDGKFELIVPKGESWLKASFSGYAEQNKQISAPYLKFFLTANSVSLVTEKIRADNSGGMYGATKELSFTQNGLISSNSGLSGYTNGTYSVVLMDSLTTGEEDRTVAVMSLRKGKFKKENNFEFSEDDSEYGRVIEEKKDLRVEYTVQSKMTIPSDGLNHSVAITKHDLEAAYEYHAVPKMDPGVYLAAQVTGWEKLNLLSGESNIYFDGTFIGKSFLDATSTKDTLSISLGKDSKLSMERTRLKDKTKVKTVGNRQHVDVAWEIKLKNNGAANIPIVIKDQFPVAKMEDIKVKNGTITNGSVNEKTGIITWKFKNGISGSQVLQMNYSVDFQSGAVLYLE